MSTLKQKAEQILQEKETNIIPDNIKSGVSIFDVSGGISIIRSGEGIPMTTNTLYITNDGYDENDYIQFRYPYISETIFQTGAMLNCQLSVFNSKFGITSDKIKKNEKLLGIVGTYEGSGIDTSDATATAEDLIEGTTAYVDGEKIEGTLELADAISIDNSTNTDTSIILTNLGNIPSMVIDADITDFYGTKKVVEDSSTLEIIVSQAQIANNINLTANKIKQGETILGVTGTYGGGSTPAVNTTLGFQTGYSYNDFPDYITFEDLESATIDLTQLYNWNRTTISGTPISTKITELPYVYLKLEIMKHYEIEGGVQVMYEFIATSTPAVSRLDEYDNVVEMAKNCYKATLQSGTFQNTDYDPETGEEYLIPSKDYSTFNEFWTDFCNVIYSDSSIVCSKSNTTTNQSFDIMMGYLYSNV